MTRQRLREGSIKWETNLSMDSFAKKIIKKIEMLAFNPKVKIINSYVPEKIKLYIDTVLLKEIEFFKKKYSFSINIHSDQNLIIPEYKIELLNKSKKLISLVENVNKLELIKPISMTTKKTNVNIKKQIVKKIDTKKKTKNKKIILRTLWVRRKKAS